MVGLLGSNPTSIMGFFCKQIIDLKLLQSTKVYRGVPGTGEMCQCCGQICKCSTDAQVIGEVKIESRKSTTL